MTIKVVTLCLYFFFFFLSRFLVGFFKAFFLFWFLSNSTFDVVNYLLLMFVNWWKSIRLFMYQILRSVKHEKWMIFNHNLLLCLLCLFDWYLRWIGFKRQKISLAHRLFLTDLPVYAIWILEIWDLSFFKFVNFTSLHHKILHVLFFKCRLESFYLETILKPKRLLGNSLLDWRSFIFLKSYQWWLKQPFTMYWLILLRFLIVFALIFSNFFEIVIALVLVFMNYLLSSTCIYRYFLRHMIFNF